MDDLAQALEGLPRNLLLARLGENAGYAKVLDVVVQRYGGEASRNTIDHALRQGLRHLGYETPAGLGHSADIAAALDAAFRPAAQKRLHLCPLDLADAFVDIDFGPNCLRGFTAAELAEIAAPWRSAPPTLPVLGNLQRLSHATWLVCEESVSVPVNPSERLWPFLHFDMNQDFGRIEPHARRFPEAVERALFALVLLPWEDIAQHAHIDWRGFSTVFVHTVDEDLLVRRSGFPSADRLSWEDQFDYATGEDYEVLERRPLDVPAGDLLSQLPQLWEMLEPCWGSEVWRRPIAHFLVRALWAEPIDEFLAHLVVIDAALGTPDDLQTKGDPRWLAKLGATKRMARRLAALLDDASAAERFETLFRLRSDYVHGAPMTAISSEHRLDARRLARRCARAMVEATPAIERMGTATWLRTLVENGHAMVDGPVPAAAP